VRRRYSGRRVAWAIVLVAAVLALFAFRGPVARGFVAVAVGVLTGDRVSLGRLSASGRLVIVDDFAAERPSGARVSARRVEIRYDLRELLGGGGRRYGLRAIELTEPRLTVVRRRDGSIELPVTWRSGSGGSTAGSAGPGAPLAFSLTIRDGGVELRDPNRTVPSARDLALEGVTLRLTAGASGLRYRGTSRVVGDGAARLAFAGRIDADGFAVHRVRGSDVALPALANYFINSNAAALASGRARALDLRLYALPRAANLPAYHLTGFADVFGGVLHVPGLVPPATGMHGRLELYDDGLVTRRLDAHLGGAAVRLCGGLYERMAPKFRLAVVSRTDLGVLRKLFRFSARLPLGGATAVSTLLEGDVGSPLVATSLQAPSFAYGRFPVSGGTGRAIYHGGVVDVVDARGAYGGLGVRGNGAIVLGGASPMSDLAIEVRGPAASIPYAAQFAPLATLHASGVVTGSGLRLDARGNAEGAGGGTVLGAAFHIDPEGDGAIGPLAAAGPRGSRLAGVWYFERSRSRSGFWLDARDYPYAGDGTGGRLPGIDLRAPAFRGTVDGEFAGVGPPSAFRLAGRLRVRALRLGRVAIDEVSGEAAGAFGNLRLGRVVARGPWGGFRGGGRYAAGRLALEGRYDGSFERLRGLTGDLGGRGSLAGPLTLLADPERVIVQSPGAFGTRASVRGLPLDSVAGTLAVAGRAVRIYAATARNASGSFAAAGDQSGYGVSFAGTGLRLATPLGALHGGRVAAIGAVTGTVGSSRFSGGLALTDAFLGGTPLSANGDVRYAGDRVSFRTMDALAAGTVAQLAGNVAGLQSRTPPLDVSIHIPSARLAPLAALVAPPRLGVAGTLAADLRAVGSGSGVRVTGSVELPEGTLAGLNFADARAGVMLDRHGVRARQGSVTVGSTRTGFSALASGADYALRVNAPRADLSDFNDLFDEGDTLEGRGRVAARFAKRDNATRTDANIAIASLRFRRFDLGDARAAWHSSGGRVTGSVDFGGASGRLDASGVLVLPAHAPLTALLARSRFTGRAQVEGLDLGVWVPALGYQLPVAGRLDATASFAGLLRNPAVSTVATLRGGSIGAFPIDRFELAASSTLERTTIHRLELDLPSISIAGTGQFGLAPQARIALSLHAESPNLADLSARLAGSRFPVTGTARADVAIDGTRAAPRVAGTVAIANASVRGVAVPQARAGFVVRGRDVVLSDAAVDFASGALALEGSVPFVVAPLSLGPASARVALTLAARDIALANFAPLLPAGSILRGTLGGTVTVGGTVGTPRLGGRLALAGGTVQSPLEAIPLTSIAAAASFDGATARLDLLHASAGDGTLDAGGSIRFADLVHPGSDATYAFVARAKALHLDLPAYGSGVIDGTLSLARVADGLPRLAGDLRLSDGTIPFSALLFAGAAAPGGFDTAVAAPGPPVPGVAFDLDVSADRNVRVRSANVDIGGRGDLHVGGTLGAPELAGGFTSTGGTITYFNTVFRLIDGTVTFAPELGVVPTLDARGVTHVINPDPNTVRNLAGTADVTLSLLGPVTNLTIGLSSDPSYDRQQILGLLLNAPALGASNLFGETRDQATLYGSNATAALPPGVATFRSTTGELSVAQEAFGIANAQFTRTLLAPIESTFASAVGLSNFNVNVDYTGNVGVSARKVLGKSVNAVYGSSFGYPYRQTFGFEIKPSPVTAAQVTVFDTLGQSGLNALTPVTSLTNAGKVGIAQPFGGTTGFSLSFQRLF
jgi:hypothetical protein